MTHRIELLKADLMDQLKNLTRLEDDFKRVAATLSLPADKVPAYDRGAIGYILHSFYNLCENMFQLIARFFENDLGPKDWHKDLLKRMKLEIHGFRPRVLDDELYGHLDDFRAFRHRFRHSYSYELDWDKERLVAEKFPKTSKMVKKQIEHFISQLGSLDFPPSG